MESFPATEGPFIVLSLVHVIKDNARYLSELDGAIGDGDHGVNMAKGFALAATRVGETTDLAGGLRVVGETLLTDIGGAMGPLYGTFFVEMAREAQVPEIDARTFAAMLDAALAGVVDVGGTQVGDKTLVDTLTPACDAFREATAAGLGFRVALQRMVAGAERGRDSTRALVARVGRASRLGERSRGSVDPGAASCALILASMATAITACLDDSSDP